MQYLALLIAFLLNFALIAEFGDGRMLEKHLQSNKTPKDNSILFMPKESATCDECQEIVRRIVEVAKNPTKVEELKLLLSALCHETHYENECRLLVSKLDIILDRLLPYLRDPESFCKEIHICANKRIQRHRSIAEFYARMLGEGKNDVVCEECQFAAHEFDQVIQNKQFQDESKEWISENICAHLGHYQGTCQLLLDDFLPEFFIELHYALQDNRQFCVDLSFCEPQRQEEGIIVGDEDSEEADGPSLKKVTKNKKRRIIALLVLQQNADMNDE